LNLVVRRVPRYGHRQRTVHHPKNRREKTSQIRSGQPPDNGADEDEIRELSEKYERAEGQGIHAEQLVKAHVKEAFTQRSNASLRHRSECRMKKCQPIVNLQVQSEPRKIVLLEPDVKTLPIKQKAQQRRHTPIRCPLVWIYFGLLAATNAFAQCGSESLVI
jgi:hypothetical protein